MDIPQTNRTYTRTHTPGSPYMDGMLKGVSRGTTRTRIRLLTNSKFIPLSLFKISQLPRVIPGNLLDISSCPIL